MTRSGLASLMVLMVTVIGCAGGCAGSGRKLTLDAIGDKSPLPGGKSVFADHTTVRINGSPFPNKLHPGQEIKAGHAVKIHLENQTPTMQDYFVVLGGASALGGNGEGRGVIHNPVLTFEVKAGWAFLWGTAIRVERDWVTGGAEGTSMIVQVIGDTKVRFFSPSDNTPDAKVYFTCGSTVREIIDPGRYAEIDYDHTSKACMFTKDDVSTAPLDVQDFIGKVKEIAKAAGF